MKKTKIEKEKHVIEYMIKKYCRKYHKEASLCSECMKLSEYAFKKLEKCPFGDKKGFCSGCPIHCYEETYRRKIKEVMKRIGPRMMYLMPLEHTRHIFSSIRSAMNITNRS